MRFWTRNAAPTAPAPTPLANQEAALRACEDRLRALEARVTDMAATTGLLRIEWAEVLDKINRWASRQTGRLARLAHANLEKAAEDDPGPAIPGEGVPKGRAVTKSDLRARVRTGGRFNGGTP